MIVFIGWSHSGRDYAKALKKFLLACFKRGVTVNVSTGLPKGSDWSDALFQQLKEANFGIMCLTPDSDSAWLCYEGGILASVGAPVAPLLFGVSSAFAPLAQKQVTPFTKEEVRKLTDDIYDSFNLNDLNNWDTYHTSFESDISKLSDWIKTPVVNKMIVYTGDFENTSSNIKILNYKHLQEHLPQMEAI